VIRARRAVAILAVAVLGAQLGAPSARAGRTVEISGRGWGHGIGMSQYGAYGRALAGRSARQILRHYYTGARVRHASVAGKVRVGLLQGRRSVHVSSIARGGGIGRVTFWVAGAPRPVAAGDADDRWRLQPSPTGGLRLYRNGDKVKRAGRTVFGSPSRPFVLRAKGSTLVRIAEKSLNYAYGKFEFATYSPGGCGLSFCLRTVLKLSMQKYVYGLGEVPASWPQASLRAQAIAARTYAHRRILASGQHRDPCDCALYDSALDQVYIGDAKRTGSGAYWDDWKRAVDRTKAVVILHRGQPIQALYSSSSGGHTENNENVWGGVPVPYLRGVRDRADGVAANPNFRWHLQMRWSRFASQLDLAYGIGKLKSFRLVRPLGVSGRVTVVKSPRRGGVRIAGSRKVARADGWSVRDALNLRDTWFRVSVSFDVAAILRDAYAELGGAPGEARGLPYSVPLGSGPELGRTQRFERGRMTWVSSLRRAVWQRGPILDRYLELGAERSLLGMPVSSVRPRSGHLTARYAHGLVTWSPVAGAHAIVGAFASAYRRTGGAEGPLGLPTSEAAGGVQRFQRGALYAARPAVGRSSGVIALWGPIYDRYRRAGGLASDCGAPLSGVVSERDRATATFERGSMTWGALGGVEVDCAAA
jgi:peptidoglycan hydrolase-like amidase